jgi:hypothetical protein
LCSVVTIETEFEEGKKLGKITRYYLFCHLRRLVFDQSSKIHPVSESRGVASEHDWKKGSY